jgi:hypothetical protein
MSNLHVSVRLDSATMARVEALAPLFSTEWRAATRSDVIRGLLFDALDRFERGARPQPRSRGAKSEAAKRKPKR